VINCVRGEVGGVRADVLDFIVFTQLDLKYLDGRGGEVEGEVGKRKSGFLKK